MTDNYNLPGEFHYSKIMSSFSELCMKTAVDLRLGRKQLYEQPDWLTEMLAEYNELGFLTVTSQPAHKSKERPLTLLCGIPSRLYEMVLTPISI